MPNIGPMELIVVLVLALVFLGPKRLPDAGKSIGNGIREFKDAIGGGGSKHQELDTSHFEAAQAVQAAQAAPVAPAAKPVEQQPAPTA